MNQPTGNLEDLFRHHLADAQVPVRPLLWEQIDNSLLIEQNALYRRRLTATRWLAAASLALASLAGGGWWAAQHHPSGAGLATAPTQSSSPVAAERTAQNSDAASGGNSGGNGLLAPGSEPASGAANRPDNQPGATASATVQPAQASNDHSYAATPSGSGASQPTSQSVNQSAANRLTASQRPGTTAALLAATSAAGPAARPMGLNQNPNPASEWLGARGRSLTTSDSRANLSGTGSGYAALPTAAAAPAFAHSAAFLAGAGADGSGAAIAAGADGTVFATLAGRAAAVQLAAQRSLPAGLATLPVTPATVPVALPKWAFGASYAVSAFQPNINFSREGSADYLYNLSPAVGLNSVALTEAAAAEYRERLQAGTGQRLSLHAARRLGKGRWSLATGLELAQNEARSASSNTFVGEQLPDVGQTTGSGDMRATQFRYRTAGVPVELRYANPIRRGWSTYGRVGAVVSALFSARAEVEGIPEASRTYSLQSAGGTYRKVLATVRGAAGVQFRPAVGSYTLSLGPVAEAGLLSLNAHPNEDFLHQNRPYSLGVEAGVAFGR